MNISNEGLDICHIRKNPMLIMDFFFHEAYLGIMLTIYVRLEVIKMNASGYFW